MRFAYMQIYWPQPRISEQFLRPGHVDVYFPSDSEVEGGSLVGPGEVLGARFAIDHLDLYRGDKAGESLFDICDAEPAGWGEVYFALFDNQGELRENVIKEPGISSILFLQKAVFHPDLNEWRSFLITRVAELFPVESLLMMWKSAVDLSTKDLAQLGFHKIANSELMVRESMLEHPYDGLQDAERANEVRLSRADEAVVDRLWG